MKGRRRVVGTSSSRKWDYGFEKSATWAVISLGELLEGKTAISLIDNDAAAGALIDASLKAPAAWALIGIFWVAAAQLSASCWVERAPLQAVPADAPSSSGLLCRSPRATEALASFRHVLQPCRIPQVPH